MNQGTEESAGRVPKPVYPEAGGEHEGPSTAREAGTRGGQVDGVCQPRPQLVRSPEGSPSQHTAGWHQLREGRVSGRTPMVPTQPPAQSGRGLRSGGASPSPSPSPCPPAKPGAGPASGAAPSCLSRGSRPARPGCPPGVCREPLISAAGRRARLSLPSMRPGGSRAERHTQAPRPQQEAGRGRCPGTSWGRHAAAAPAARGPPGPCGSQSRVFPRHLQCATACQRHTCPWHRGPAWQSG